LVATGRRPDLRPLGVDRVGLDPGADHVATDPHLRAGERLWAVGDVTGRGAFTHVAYYQAHIAAADILGNEHEPADYDAVPRVTFTDPELGSVGLTEAQARSRGVDVLVGTQSIADSDRGWLYGRGADLGVLKLVADAGSGRLLGGSVLSPVGGETAALLALAVRARIPVALLSEVILPYPTFARALRGALRRLA
jgi:pyruvate/2-oxoglutarate dehydrogenase complex dihydrolipoamide dehydrogenase (E3) component